MDKIKIMKDIIKKRKGVFKRMSDFDNEKKSELDEYKEYLESALSELSKMLAMGIFEKKYVINTCRNIVYFSDEIERLSNE